MCRFLQQCYLILQTPHVGDIIGDILIDEELKDGHDNYDLYNEDTFGSGAVGMILTTKHKLLKEDKKLS